MADISDLEEMRQARMYAREKPSTSYLQRRMGIRYDHAMRLMDALEKEGVVSERLSNGTRTVLR